MRRCSHISLVKNLNTQQLSTSVWKAHDSLKLLSNNTGLPGCQECFYFFVGTHGWTKWLKLLWMWFKIQGTFYYYLFIISYHLLTFCTSRVTLRFENNVHNTWNCHEIYYFCFPGRYKKAVLVNVFQWFNKGDHLITIGQRRILERMGIQLIYHCFYPGRNCDFSAINKNDPELVST